MKRKSLMIFVSLISMAVLSGCGSNETVGDKLINENPTAITPEIVEWTTESTNNNNEENIEEAEGNMEAAEDSKESEEAIEESTEENPEDNSEENTEGENESAKEADTEESDSDEHSESENEASEGSESENSAEESEDKIKPESIILEKENNIMVFSNVSGKDIDKLYVTFSEGNINNLEVLGVEDLNDGFCFKYAITDISSIKNVGIITLNVTAKTKKDESIDFGSLEIIDVTNLSVVLSKNAGNYCMYLE